MPIAESAPVEALKTIRETVQHVVTAISAAASAVANVGPGLGPVVGPVGNYASLPDAAKWALSFGMLLGRLEVFTVLVLFTPAFWRP